MNDSVELKSSQGKKLLGISLLFLLFSLLIVGLATWFFLTKVVPATDPLVRFKSSLETITQQEVVQEGLYVRNQNG